ncbi:MAG: response regulator [Pontiella sp.]|nr:response regulator [Pontiella sp.]
MKRKILLILSLATIISVIVASILLAFLFNLHRPLPSGADGGMSPLLIAIIIYLSSSLSLLALINFLLGKHMIVPIVEREMMDNERAMLTEQLHHSQKMEAVGRLAGSIAHDFNNLLTIIDGYTSLIIADPQAAETEQNAKEVVSAARKASFITRKLLSFSQKEKTEPMLLNLNTTLEDTKKMLARLIGEKITLITKPYDEPIYAMTDPVQMGQVLMNLAVNARDAMPNGGRITIKVGSRQVSNGQCNKPDSLPAGDYAEISVQDTGMGIDEETIGKIFEAFFTTKKDGKGTGLGLSIVKGIMKENNGFIDVSSKVGGGTTFMVYLPLSEVAEGDLPDDELQEPPALGPAPAAVQPASAVEQAPEPTASEVSGDTPTILLVEDDPMILTLVAQTLESQGYHVLQAKEGWEGVKVGRNYKGKIDMLFTDVVMNGLGGAELAIATQELYPDIKVLFMSGYSRTQLDDEGVPHDAELLEKPFTPDKVISMVRRLLES